MYTRNDLLKILDMSTRQMEMEIKELPEAIRTILEQMIATEIANGHLDSIAKSKKTQ